MYNRVRVWSGYKKGILSILGWRKFHFIFLQSFKISKNMKTITQNWMHALHEIKKKYSVTWTVIEIFYAYYCIMLMAPVWRLPSQFWTGIELYFLFMLILRVEMWTKVSWKTAILGPLIKDRPGDLININFIKTSRIGGNKSSTSIYWIKQPGNKLSINIQRRI